MPGHRLDIPSVALQDTLFAVRRPIPDPDGRIVATRDEFGVGRRKAESVNGLSIVTVHGLDGCNAGRPVLDVARSIAGHAAKAGIVRTHDEFKAKGDSVP
eukprot:scaffold6592_cov53-Attheya_sp.AAC.2